MRKKKGERNSVCRKNNGTLFPLMFWIIQDIRNIFAMFPSPLSPVLFACLFFFPLSSSFTSLHSNSLISPSQFKQGVRPSPIYFSYGLFFFSFFLYNRPAFSLIVAADFSIGRHVERCCSPSRFPLGNEKSTRLPSYLYSPCANTVLFLYNCSMDRSSNNRRNFPLTFLYFSSSKLIIHSSISSLIQLLSYMYYLDTYHVSIHFFRIA